MIAATSRRRFLTRTGLALLGSSALGRAMAQQPATPLFQISLAQWSLHNKLGKKELTNLDFPKYTKETFNIDAVEYVNRFFELGPEGKPTQDYLNQLKTNCEEHGVTSVLIMVDGEGALGDPDQAKRDQAVENHRKWLEAAQFLGCHSIRVNAQSGGTDQEQHDRVVDGLTKLGKLGAEFGLNVIVENHGGLSSNGAWLAKVMTTVAMDNVGTLPDFGNFHIHGYDAYQGIEETMPFAKGVSAKSREFDENGNEKQVDYRRALKICLDAGYHGHYGIEWEGGGISEDEGIIKTRDLLIRLREELAPDYAAVPAQA